MPNANARIDLSPQQLELLDGLLLGDGCVAIRRGRNSRFQYYGIHSDLVRLVHKQLDFPGRCPYQRVNPDSAGGMHHIWGFYTSGNPVWNDLRIRWYPEGVKVVPNDLNLSVVALLFWYLGDGGLSNSVNSRVSLSTHQFKHADVDFLIYLLKSNWGLTSAVAYSDRGKPRLYLNHPDSESFLKIVGPPPVHTLRYKWRIKSNGHWYRRVTPEDRAVMIKMRADGSTQHEIAEQLGLTQSTVSRRLGGYNASLDS